MGQNSVKSRCWKPSKSVFRFFGRFDASEIEFLTIFTKFNSKMPSEMDPQINQKSILASRKGPQTAQDPSRTQFWIDFS